MIAKSLFAAVLLIAASGVAQAAYEGPAKPAEVAQGMVEQYPAAQSNPKAQAAKARMSAIVKQMAAPGIDQLARENLRVQYQSAVKDYRSALSRAN